LTARAHIFANCIAFFCFAVLATGCTTTAALRASPFEIPSERFAAIVVEESSGKVLFDVRSNAIRFPASLTKMMTIFMVLEALENGTLSMSTQITFSPTASAKPASKLWIKPGDSVSVDQALTALAVKSANDVACAVAEHLSGTEQQFAVDMTRKARSLGMMSTTFRNASGLPDKRQVTTAKDMARLGIVLRQRFPKHFYYFKQQSMQFRGKTIRGHNRVLGSLKGADGIKTGYTRASGFNLVTSAQTRRGRVVGVILGENSSKTRDAHMVQLFNAYAN